MIPRGWKIERQADVLKTIHVTAPNGYVASVNAIDRNPANVLYMLADALLKGTDAEIYKSIADNYAAGLAPVEAPSKCEFPVCAVHHPCERNCERRAAAGVRGTFNDQREQP